MSNLKFDLLYTQDKLKPEVDSWVRFSPINTPNLDGLFLSLELSPNLIQHQYNQVLPEENNSNLIFYEAKLGFHQVLISPQEYRLFVDSNRFNLNGIHPDLDIPNSNYLSIKVYDVELKSNSSQELETISFIDIILPVPINSSKEIYVLSEVDLKNYEFNINYYVDYAKVDDLRLEENYRQSICLLTITNFPKSKSRDVNLELILNEELVSVCTAQLYFKTIPASEFSTLEEQSATLEDIAYSLSVILHQEQWQLASNTLIGLRNKLEETNYILPSTILRTSNNETVYIRTIKSYCLLLFFISQINEVFPTSAGLNLMTYLQKEISKAISIKTGTLIYGYDGNDKPYDFEDFSLLFLGYLSLSTSQEYIYNEETEFTLAILREQIKFTYDTSFSQISKYNLATIIEGSFWAALLAHYENRFDNLAKLALLIKYYINSYPSNITYSDKIYYNLFLDLLNHNNITTDLTSYNLGLNTLGEGLYTTQYKNNLSTLKLSSMVLFSQNQMYLNYKYNYINYTTNSIYYKELLETYIKKFLPFGLGWFNSNAMQTKLGVLQAIIKAIGYGCLTAIIRYYSSLNKLDINKAQGKYLDSWGLIINKFRKLGESDFSYRKRLIDYILFRGETIKNITESLKRIEPTVEVTINNTTKEVEITGNYSKALVEMVSSLNYIGCKISIIVNSTYKVDYKSGGIFYAGSNDYS